MRHCERYQLGGRVEKGNVCSSFGTLDAAWRDFFTRLIDNENKCLHKCNDVRIIGVGLLVKGGRDAKI